jgi:hypothetical protein
VIALEVDKEVALKNILFATDFSRGSNVALPYAVSLARQHGAMLHASAQMQLSGKILYPRTLPREHVLQDAFCLSR